MNRHAGSDVLRVTELEKQYRVITVSESTVAVAGREHLNTNFKVRCRSLLNGIRAVVGRRILVLLDYFWLERNYYRSNYGRDWLHNNGKVEQLLRAGADEVLLPHDKGSEMENMLLATRLDWRYLPKEDHPLWVATERCRDAMEGRGSHETQLGYLHPEHPFIVVSIDTNRWCRPPVRL